MSKPNPMTPNRQGATYKVTNATIKEELTRHSQPASWASFDYTVLSIRTPFA